MKNFVRHGRRHFEDQHCQRQKSVHSRRSGRLSEKYGDVLSVTNMTRLMRRVAVVEGEGAFFVGSDCLNDDDNNDFYDHGFSLIMTTSGTSDDRTLGQIRRISC